MRSLTLRSLCLAAVRWGPSSAPFLRVSEDGRRAQWTESLRGSAVFVTAQSPLKETAKRWTVRMTRPVAMELHIGLRGPIPARTPSVVPRVSAWTHVLALPIAGEPASGEPASMPVLFSPSAGVLTLSIEADMRAERLWVWGHDGRLLTGVFNGIPDLANALPTVSVYPDPYGGAEWTAARAPTVELLDCYRRRPR
jgi:hypothetical protein